jgi:hypothetical protein
MNFMKSKSIVYLPASLPDYKTRSSETPTYFNRFVLLLGLFLACTFSMSRVSSGYDKRIQKGGFTQNKVCGSCHEDIFNMWRNSLHAQAYEDPIFQAAYLEAYVRSEGKVKTFCFRCHAPTSTLTKDFDAKMPLTREGVTCDFCHSVKGIHLDERKSFLLFEIDPGTRKWGPIEDTTICLPHHKAGYSELHTRSEFCAGCHEYTNEQGVPILSTYSEWKEGPYSDKDIHCQNCHMPLVEGKVVSPEIKKIKERRINLHNLAGGHSIAKVKDAMKIEITSVQRKEDRVVAVVAIINSGSGHSIPTGIPTRKLILTVTAELPRGEALKQERVYQKVLLDKNGKEILRDSEIFTEPARIAQDNRIKSGERREEVFTFKISSGKDVVISARVKYLYQPLLLQETEMSIEIDHEEWVSPAK